jgi:hypothetical protein
LQGSQSFLTDEAVTLAYPVCFCPRTFFGTRGEIPQNPGNPLAMQEEKDEASPVGATRSTRVRQGVQRLRSSDLTARTNKTRDEGSPQKTKNDDAKTPTAAQNAKKGRKPKCPSDQGLDNDSDEQEKGSKEESVAKNSASEKRKKGHKQPSDNNDNDEDSDLDTPLALLPRKDPLKGLDLHFELANMIASIPDSALGELSLRDVRR